MRDITRLHNRLQLSKAIWTADRRAKMRKLDQDMDRVIFALDRLRITPQYAEETFMWTPPKGPPQDRGYSKQVMLKVARFGNTAKPSPQLVEAVKRTRVYNQFVRVERLRAEMHDLCPKYEGQRCRRW